MGGLFGLWDWSDHTHHHARLRGDPDVRATVNNRSGRLDQRAPSWGELRSMLRGRLQDVTSFRGMRLTFPSREGTRGRSAAWERAFLRHFLPATPPTP
eukprot:gene15357-37054_t